MERIITIALWLTILGLAILFIFNIQRAHASDTFYGIGILGGEQLKSDTLWHTSPNHNWQEFQIRPIYGKHMTKRWDLWIEGNLGYMRWKDGHDGIKLGALIMTDYDIIKYKDVNFYTEFGVGTGWMSYTSNTRMVRNNLLGFIDYGCGLEFQNIKLGPRFHHTSSMFGKDSGINTYGFMVIFKF